MDEEKDRYEKNMERIRAQKREALPPYYDAPPSYAPPSYAPPSYASLHAKQNKKG
jgi:hypothetical protein